MLCMNSTGRIIESLYYGFSSLVFAYSFNIFNSYRSRFDVKNKIKTIIFVHYIVFPK